MHLCKCANAQAGGGWEGGTHRQTVVWIETQVWRMQKMHPSFSHMHTQQIGFIDTDSELRNHVGAGEQCKETRNLIYRRRYGGGVEEASVCLQEEKERNERQSAVSSAKTWRGWNKRLGIGEDRRGVAERIRFRWKQQEEDKVSDGWWTELTLVSHLNRPMDKSHCLICLKLNSSPKCTNLKNKKVHISKDDLKHVKPFDHSQCPLWLDYLPKDPSVSDSPVVALTVSEQTCTH